MRYIICTCLAIFITMTSVMPAPAREVSGKKAPVEQTLCPVLDNPIDRSIYTDYKGKRIYFCCPSCKDDFAKNPEKYMKKMRDQGVEPAAVPGR